MLNWGIAGTGNIAKAFALALNHTDQVCAYGVAGRNPEKTRAFAQEHHVSKAFDSFDSMFRDPAIDVVYVCPPHPFHADLACRALEQGKHVLCEKPMAMSMEDIQRMFELAKKQNRLLLEGYMYRYHPQTKRLVELLNDGVIGEIKTVESSFCFACKFDPASRLFNPALGGGAVWDIGGYPLSFANLIAATSNENHLLPPSRLEAVAILTEDGVDLQSTAIAVYPNGILARMNVGVDATQDNRLRIYGTRGMLTVFDPWVCDRKNPPQGRILLERYGEQPETICIPARKTSYVYEAEYFSSRIMHNRFQTDFPIMSMEETLLQNTLLQCWINKIGAVGSVKQGVLQFPDSIQKSHPATISQ